MTDRRLVAFATVASLAVGGAAASLALCGCDALIKTVSHPAPDPRRATSEIAIAIVADGSIFYGRENWSKSLREWAPTLCDGDSDLALVRVEGGADGKPLKYAGTPERSDIPSVQSAVAEALALAPKDSGSDVATALVVGRDWLATRKATRKILLVFSDFVADPARVPARRTFADPLLVAGFAENRIEVHVFGVPAQRADAVRAAFPDAGVAVEGADFDPKTLALPQGNL